MSARRRERQGSIYYEEQRQRWVGAVEIGPDASGQRSRRRVTGATRAEVRQKLRAIERDAVAGIDLAEGRQTVAAFLEDWLTHVLPSRDRSVNTIDNYTWAVRHHLIPSLGTIRLSDLTADDVDKMLRSRAAAGMSRNSMMRIRSVLVMALRHAERRNRIRRNVANLVDTPAGPSHPGRALTHEQALRLLDVVGSHPAKALVTTALMLGLRPGEVLGLTWDDVDLTRGVLHIRRSLKRERNQLRLGTPKTARSRRSLDLPRPVIDVLTIHHAHHVRLCALGGPDWNPENVVFPSETGTLLDPSNLRRTFARLTTAAGLGHWTPKDLRHTAATLLSAAGVPLERVADVLGHDGTRMTALVYRHAIAPSSDAAVEPMNDLFG